MSHTRISVLVVSAAVVAVACGSADPGVGSPVVANSAGTTSTSEAQATSTTEEYVLVEADYPMPEYEAGKFLDGVAAGDSVLVRASVAVGADMVGFEVVEAVAGEGSPEPSYEVEPLWVGVTTGDEALIVVSRDDVLLSVAVYDPVLEELRPPSDPLDPRVWLGLKSSVEGLTEAPRDVCGIGRVVGEADYPSLLALFEAHIAGTTPKQRYDAAAETRHALYREAERIVDQAAGSHVDEVTGWTTSYSERAVLRALTAGEDVDASDLIPTVPVFLAANDLSGFTNVALIDVEALEVLGSLQLPPGLHTGDSDYVIVDVDPVAPGHTVTVVTYGDRDLVGCAGGRPTVERLLEVGTVVGSASHDAMAGSQRLLIDLSTGRVAGLDRGGLRALDDWIGARIEP